MTRQAKKQENMIHDWGGGCQSTETKPGMTQIIALAGEDTLNITTVFRVFKKLDHR